MRCLLVGCAVSLAAPLRSPAESGNLSVMMFYDFNQSAQCGWTTHMWRELGSDAPFKRNMSVALQEVIRSNEDCQTLGFFEVPDAVWPWPERKLAPDWQAQIASFSETLQPFVANGTVTGVFLGDELMCNGGGIPLSDFTSVLAELRRGLGNVLLYTNECSGTISLWDKIPDELDLISIDFYDQGNKDGLQEVRQTQSYVEQVVSPRLAAHQRLLLVPGIFGNSPEICSEEGDPCPLEEQQVQIVKKLEAFFSWAKADGRIAGFNPWHFDWRPTMQHSRPWDQRVGAVQMPLVLDKLREIGTYIRSVSQPVGNPQWV